MDQVEKEIKHKGGKISKAEMKALRKVVKDHEKKHHHKALYMALCGLFITVLPFPPCKTYGPQLIAAGVGLAIEGGCGKVEEDRKNDKDKK